MSVTPRGEDTVAALREWIASEIRNAPSKIFEIAKFLFSVSTTSIGLLVTLTKFLDFKWNTLLSISVLLLAISCAIALWVALPTLIVLDGRTDLSRKHATMVYKGYVLMVTWSILWSIALLCFVLATT